MASILQFGDYEPVAKLPDDISLELGRLVAALAFLEWQLQKTLWQTFRLGGKWGRVLTGAMNTRSRADALVMGVGSHYGKSDLVAEVKFIAGKLEELQSRRNEFVHGIYVSSPSRPNQLFAIVSGSSSEKRARPRAVDVHVTRIAALTADVEALSARLGRFFAAIEPLR